MNAAQVLQMHMFSMCSSGARRGTRVYATLTRRPSRPGSTARAWRPWAPARCAPSRGKAPAAASSSPCWSGGTKRRSRLTRRVPSRRSGWHADARARGGVDRGRVGPTLLVAEDRRARPRRGRRGRRPADSARAPRSAASGRPDAHGRPIPARSWGEARARGPLRTPRAERAWGGAGRACGIRTR